MPGLAKLPGGARRRAGIAEVPQRHQGSLCSSTAVPTCSWRNSTRAVSPEPRFGPSTSPSSRPALSPNARNSSRRPPRPPGSRSSPLGGHEETQLSAFHALPNGASDTHPTRARPGSSARGQRPPPSAMGGALKRHSTRSKVPAPVDPSEEKKIIFLWGGKEGERHRSGTNPRPTKRPVPTPDVRKPGRGGWQRPWAVRAPPCSPPRGRGLSTLPRARVAAPSPPPARYPPVRGLSGPGLRNSRPGPGGGRASRRVLRAMEGR